MITENDLKHVNDVKPIHTNFKETTSFSSKQNIIAILATINIDGINEVFPEENMFTRFIRTFIKHTTQ